MKVDVDVDVDVDIDVEIEVDVEIDVDQSTTNRQFHISHFWPLAENANVQRGDVPGMSTICRSTSIST